MGIKAEWKKGPDFAEYAEALGIRTIQIMAAQRHEDAMIVVYTPEEDENDLDPETMILAARVARDGDGIMRQIGEPYVLPLNWSEMTAEIEKRLDGRA